MADYEAVYTAEGDRFFKELEELKRMKTYVGFQAGSHFEENGEDVVNVAYRNEFGTEKIPSRPFMAQTVDNHLKEITDVVAKSAQRGQDAAGITRLIGEAIADLMRKEIENGDFVPNSPYTIAKKGSDKPLIDTGTMMDSIEHWTTKE